MEVDAGMREAAAELLELEGRVGKLDDKERRRWTELAKKVFGGESTRRSFRLRAGVPAAIEFSDGRVNCEMREVSHLGVSLAGGGAELSSRSEGDTGELVSVQIDGKDRDFSGLHLEVVRISAEDEHCALGLNFLDKTGDDEWQRFFDEVYYPLYVKHLEHIAAS